MTGILDCLLPNLHQTSNFGNDYSTLDAAYEGADFFDVGNRKAMRSVWTAWHAEPSGTSFRVKFHISTTFGPNAIEQDEASTYESSGPYILSTNRNSF